ncbi:MULTISPECIES: PmeII family type II restriction endonuclease [Bacillus]|uniref:PmeII family type II restriction endonuclease n=1 Tax=Bacillus TaxID=1386 RepID=UPI0005A34844|nr:MULTISPECIES: PmeII family type II restriction endonuclease [Bacillus]AJH26035.1 MjaII restriction endonuclease [Bacillus velezensis]AKD24141.1 MjaII restriction endonuclease [Bacillus velezensis]KAF6602447.1 restriction endonuclease [Bacillus sp. EKM420B]KAF6607004.1 restriction endonuclease [Bacillus sp. EKM417B]MEC1925755.1 PmeII family type II restriction endonuclease [Bacillus velezensis]
MNTQHPDDIIEKAKDFFRNEIAKSHLANTLKLKELKHLSLNPFLDKYRANFLAGNDNPQNIARALVYPRVLGTSLNTTFGNKLQKFCSDVLDGFASTTSGIDIEFIDKLDGNRKYCQIKAGPNTINADDVPTIKNHFLGIKNLARTNNLSIGFNDLVVGVFYGSDDKLSGHYKKIKEEYPVIVGAEFWYRLTGEENFYKRLTDAIGEIASEFDGSKLIEEVIDSLAKQIEEELKEQESLEE